MFVENQQTFHTLVFGLFMLELSINDIINIIIVLNREDMILGLFSFIYTFIIGTFKLK
jgi:hypothetical protein